MTRPAQLDDETRAELAALGFRLTAARPLDLLFQTSATRSQSKLIRAHRTKKALPAGALVRLSAHVLIASPELAWLQACEDLNDGQLLMAGAEMCGTYYLVGADGRMASGVGEREALTSVARIMTTLERMGCKKRSRAALLAVRIAENAASPMEARTAYLLSLPRAMGGYALPAPVLNAPIELSPEARTLYPHAMCRADLCWSAARFAVEYDGRATHEGQLVQDSARIAALKATGLNVLTVTSAQVYSDVAFAEVAALVAKALGVRQRVRRDAEVFAQARAALRSQLSIDYSGEVER